MDKSVRASFYKKFPLSFKNILRWLPSMKEYRPYILPTRHGLAFLVALFFLFLMALSYGHSMAFAATFFLTSLLMSSAFLTHLNLKGTFVSHFHAPDVFRLGELAPFKLELSNQTKRNKNEIALYKWGTQKMMPSEGVNLQAFGSRKASFFLGPLSVGKYTYKDAELMTSFPLGLFYSWMKFSIKGSFYVAPAAVDHLKKGPPLIHKGQDNQPLEQGLEVRARDEGEFSEHRPFDQDSDSWHRIDWKAYAKKDILLKKTYADPAAPIYSLDLRETRALHLKEAYEQLSFWLSVCENEGARWNLYLKNTSLKNKEGVGDIKSALKALSLEAKQEAFL